jgi:hypothetical protein
MKYKITDKQLDDVIFLYLDNQDFIRINMNNSIYFVNSEGDTESLIRFTKNDGKCVIYVGLIAEVASFFSLQGYDAREAIGRWVGDRENVNIDHCVWIDNQNSVWLKIPNK